MQLPTYPFERKRHWVEPAPGASRADVLPGVATNGVTLSPPTQVAEEPMTEPTIAQPAQQLPAAGCHGSCQASLRGAVGPRGVRLRRVRFVPGSRPRLALPHAGEHEIQKTLRREGSVPRAARGGDDDRGRQRAPSPSSFRPRRSPRRQSRPVAGRAAPGARPAARSRRRRDPRRAGHRASRWRSCPASSSCSAGRARRRSFRLRQAPPAPIAPPPSAPKAAAAEGGTIAFGPYRPPARGEAGGLDGPAGGCGRRARRALRSRRPRARSGSRPRTGRISPIRGRSPASGATGRRSCTRSSPRARPARSSGTSTGTSTST